MDMGIFIMPLTLGPRTSQWREVVYGVINFLMHTVHLVLTKVHLSPRNQFAAPRRLVARHEKEGQQKAIGTADFGFCGLL
jgi:hypothetical protein